MPDLLHQYWPWHLAAFLLGALITWRLLPRPAAAVPHAVPAEAPIPAPAPPVEAPTPRPPAFSHRMDTTEPTAPLLYDAPPTTTGRYGPGSADAVPHQSPPDGYTIKATTHPMLFHTPDSPYYGRTTPDVWFRTPTDAERAGFTHSTHTLRRSRR